MSTSNGHNITIAIQVLRKTYENLNRLFSEMDRAAEEEGFVPLTTKFLRWKSDAQTDGWLSSNFIKLYQKASDPLYSSQDGRSILEDTELRAGSVYGVEIDLADEKERNYPTMTVFQNYYQLSEWPRLPQISDHWIFYYPLHDSDCFTYTKMEQDRDLWTHKATAKGKKKYWGIVEGTHEIIPLTNVCDYPSVKKEIFERMNNLDAGTFDTL